MAVKVSLLVHSIIYSHCNNWKRQCDGWCHNNEDRSNTTGIHVLCPVEEFSEARGIWETVVGAWDPNTRPRANQTQGKHFNVMCIDVTLQCTLISCFVWQQINNTVSWFIYSLFSFADLWCSYSLLYSRNVWWILRIISDSPN